MHLASRHTPPHIAPDPLVSGPSFDAPQARTEPWPEHFAFEGLDSFLWRMTEECIDDMIAAQHARIPSPESTMPSHRSSMRTAEVRMFAQIDAALCLGPALLGRLEATVSELADPDSFFAHVLLTGCVAMPRSLTLLENVWRASLEHDDEVQRAAQYALCLVSHPEVTALARRLLREGDVRLKAASARVLSYRSDSREQDILQLLQADDPAARCAAVEALRHPSYDSDDWQPQLHTLLHDTDERVVLAALRVALCKRAPEGRRRALASCERGQFAFADAALALALAGEEQDVERFSEWLPNTSDVALLRASGYLGAASFVPLLIGRLLSSTPGVPDAAAEALSRILGADPRETREVPLHEEEDKPFVDDPEATVEREVLARTPAAWNAVWEAKQKTIVMNERYRAGVRYAAPVLHQLLDQGSAAPEERRLLQLELSMLAGVDTVHLEVDDWLSRQVAATARWGEWAGGRAAAPRRGFIRART